MNMPKKIRGSGFKHTLPAVVAFSTIWFIVVLAATAPVITVAAMVSDLLTVSLRREVWFFLGTGLLIILLGVVALSLFTTARLAGPFVALQRAFDDVKNGDMNRRLRFRRGDEHLYELETAFNEMMATLRERTGYRAAGDAPAEDL